MKAIFIVAFLLGNAFIGYAYTADWGEPLLFPTFLLLLLVATAGFHRALSRNELNLDLIVWVFVYLFFCLSPIVQLGSGNWFPNSLPIVASAVVETNLLLLAWCLLYLLFGRAVRPRLSSARPPANGERMALGRIAPSVRALYFTLSAAIFALTFASLGFDFFLGHADYGAIVSQKSTLLLVNIAFQGIVFANWLFAFDRWRPCKRKLLPMLYFIASTCIVVYQIGPFNTNRSYLGFCLILVLFLFYGHRIRPGAFLTILFGGMLFIFPVLNYYRYGLRSFEWPPLGELMFEQLKELHFDAYSNLIASMQYVDVYGTSHGYGLLGVLLFFVPRSMWLDKPLSSGEMIGDFISTRYAMNFNNISNPLPSEFYLNFGWLGVVASALLLAWAVGKLEVDPDRDRFRYALIAGYLFILLRGDLMSAFAYCFGTFVIMVVVPGLLSGIVGRSAGAAREKDESRREEGQTRAQSIV